VVQPKNFSIRPFQPNDQQAARDLILEGLGEHWGYINPGLNPDLDDIAENFREGLFLVACWEDQIIGTGGLIPREQTTGEIVRMSTAAGFRRLGVGTMILKALCDFARSRGFQQVVLETTTEWEEVIAFYLRFGFYITHQEESEFGPNMYFSLDLW